MKPFSKPRVGLALGAFVTVALLGPRASAEAPFGAETTSKLGNEVKGPRSESDGTYGRLDGDLDLGFGLGALVDLEHGEPGAAVRASGHWFFMAGAYLSYADAFGTALDPKRRLGVGIDLRPLFIPRWTQDWEQGPAILDLTLDSLSLGLGASFDQPHGEAFGVRRAFEASLGFGVPLAGRGPGPWLEARAALAWPNVGERSETLLIVGSYHFALGTPLVGGD